jgi:hypothetical protein
MHRSYVHMFRFGDTALHQCCRAESKNIDALRTLLKLNICIIDIERIEIILISFCLFHSFVFRHGGDPLLVNDKNQSVTDLASKTDDRQLLQAIALHRDQQKAKERMERNYSGSRQ